MGRLDQFAKETLALETPAVTRGAVRWELPPELNMSEVRIDGLLRVLDPAALAALAAPWSVARCAGEIVLENKMPGDHLDMTAVDRAVLRRQARQVQRREDAKTPWDGETPLWVLAPHMPAILSERRTLEQVEPGCYHVGPSPFPFLWIAANELPLAEELIPFLIARSGRALDQFGQWVKERRAPAWLTRVVELLPMSVAVVEEILRFALTKSSDPEVNERKRVMVNVLVDTTPGVRDELVGEGRREGRREGQREGKLEGERTAVKRVLARRGLSPSAAEEARIDACADLDTLLRWLDQAVVAESVDEALR